MFIGMMKEPEHTHTLDEPQLVCRENIPFVWPYVQPRLRDALDKFQFAEYTAEDLQQLLMQGAAQLWIAGNVEGIAITRVVTYNHIRRLIIDFIDIEGHPEFEDHLEFLEAWGAQQGATQVEAECRPGLAPKALRKFGYKQRRVKVFKHLKQGLH